MSGATGFRAAWAAAAVIYVCTGAARAENLGDRTVTMWAPYLEWSLSNPTFSGNPFDVVASATFVHGTSGETRLTEMFYDGGNTWKFRFTGTRVGTWTFSTTSSDADLNGHNGTITVGPNPNPGVSADSLAVRG